MNRLNRAWWMVGLAVLGVVLQVGGCPPNPTGQLTLATAVIGHGHIDMSPTGGSYDSGTDVTLTAVADAGWVFDHWTGALTDNTNPATVTMDQAKNVTAVFVDVTTLTEWTQTDISADTTIPAGNYQVNDDITVENNATLTLSPGTTLRFASGAWLYVGNDGALNAVGTDDAPITLTGITETPGFWIGVRFVDSNNSNNQLKYVTIKNAGYDYASVAADLYIGGTSRVAVSDCILRDSGSLGFVFHNDPNITFDSNTITANADGAGEIEPSLVDVLTTTSTYTGNTTDVMLVRGGNTDVDGQTWSNLGVPYILADDLTVTAHTIFAPGVQVQFPTNAWVYVGNTGSLTAVGTAAKPILLTGQSNTRGFWIGLRFVDSASADNKLQYVTIRYAGYDYASVAADLYIGGTSQVDVDHCILCDSGSLGFVFNNSPDVTFSNNTVTANKDGAGRVPPWLVGALTTTSDFANNDKDVLMVQSGNTTVDQTWSDLGLTYIMADDLTVTAHTTFAAGVQVQFPSNSWLYVGNTGSLTASGTATNPILLTGQTQSPGFWRGVRFVDSNNLTNNVLQYVTIEYGGYSYGSVWADLFAGGTTKLTLQNCTIRQSSGYGIWDDSVSTITGIGTTSFANNASGNEH